MAVGRSNKAQDLIYTTNYVDSTLKIGEVRAWFQAELSVACLGVVSPEGFGLISRSQVNSLLAGHLNDGEILNKQISEIMLPSPLVVEVDQDIHQVVQALFDQRSSEDTFFNDIIVQDRGTFTGLISVRDLLVNYTEGLQHRLSAMEAQQTALSRKHKELFETNFRNDQHELQFREAFEMAPLPIAMFDANGNVTMANPRFQRLTQFDTKLFKAGLTFPQVFAGEYAVIHSTLTQQWSSGEKADGEVAAVAMDLLTAASTTVPVDCIVELTNDGLNVMLSIVSIGEENTLPDRGVPSEPVSELMDVVNKSSGKRPGRITQAIRSKLEGENARGLARVVATNLIDREQQVDLMMKKLENIINVAERIEKQEVEIKRGSSSKNDDGQKLSGNLQEFSCIDLCQILIQGSKTGQLIIMGNATSKPLGSIFFERGQMVHAVAVTAEPGVEAVQKIARLKQGRFEFMFDERSTEKTIEGDSLGILMDCCRVLDEDTNPV